MFIKKSIHFVKKNYIYIIIFVSTLATVGSLALSELVGLAPCDLCWYQRIFMYSIFVVSIISAIIKDEINSHKYIMSLSIPGIIIALYNYFIQLFPNSSILECSINNPCTKVDFMLFGFLTIPLMSAIAFTFIIFVSYIKNGNIREGD